MSKKVILTATRAGSDRVYIFSYKENEEVRLPLNSWAIVQVKATEISQHYSNFDIIASDNFCGPGGTIFPVRFKVSKVEYVEEPTKIDELEFVSHANVVIQSLVDGDYKEMHITRGDKVVAKISKA